MKPINIEILMGHSVGLSDSYYRATERDLLEDYLKAVTDFLTTSNENQAKRIQEPYKIMMMAIIRTTERDYFDTIISNKMIYY